MSDTFSISVREWLGPGSGDAVEQATNAEICIKVREYCVTEVEDFASKTVRSTIRVSAGPMARWILQNWWRLKCEAEPIFATESIDWAMSHSMAAIGNGYVWPDLVFLGSDGSHISVVCTRHHSLEHEKFSPVRFLNSFNRATISVADFETGARSFLEVVLSRLSNLGIRKSDLHDLWNDVSAEWANPQYSAYRKLEALLGLEPDQNDALISSVLKWGRQFGRKALEEIAAESSSYEILQILEAAKTLASKVRTFADIPNSEELSVWTVDDSLPRNLAPWQRAQSLAYALREKWGFDRAPIRDKDLADRLSLKVEQLQKTFPAASFSFGVRGPAGKVGFLLSRSHDRSRRFDTARLIGDYVAFDREERLLPATNTVTERQKFQRAFAAEFLCPSAMIKDQYGTVPQRSIGKVIDEISSDYEVSEQVVRHHMENRQVLSREFLESSLLLA